MRSVVDGLCTFAGRGACTDAERRAALWLHDELRSRGHEAWVETRWVRPRRAAMLALGCLLAVAGGLLAPPRRSPASCSRRSACCRWRSRRPGGLGPRAGAVPAPRDAARADRGGPTRASSWSITAAYDAPRARPACSTTAGARGCGACPAWALAVCGPRSRPPRLPGSRASSAGWLGAVQLVPTLVLLVALAAAADVALSSLLAGRQRQRVRRGGRDGAVRRARRASRRASLRPGGAAHRRGPRRAALGRPPPARRGAGRRARSWCSSSGRAAPAGPHGRPATRRSARPPSAPPERSASARARAPRRPGRALPARPHRLPRRSRDQPARAPGGRHAGERRRGRHGRGARPCARGGRRARRRASAQRAPGATSRG